MTTGTHPDARYTVATVVHSCAELSYFAINVVASLVHVLGNLHLFTYLLTYLDQSVSIVVCRVLFP